MLTYTVVPDTGYVEEESEVVLYETGHRVRVCMPSAVLISKQQLGELGVLFIALAGNKCDWDRAAGLIDGYGMSTEETQRIFKNVVKEFKEYHKLIDYAHKHKEA